LKIKNKWLLVWTLIGGGLGLYLSIFGMYLQADAEDDKVFYQGGMYLYMGAMFCSAVVTARYQRTIRELKDRLSKYETDEY
jgi:hypothetical protein